MNKSQVIGELCKLTRKVGKEVFNNNRAHDCFCRESIVSDRHFQFEEPVFEFIRQAVDEKIERDRRGL